MPRALTVEEKVAKVEAARNPVKQVRTTSERARRGVFNGTQQKLTVQGDIEGYHMHIFNDIAGRIEEALSAGYEFVSPTEIGGTSVNVVSRNTDLGDKVRFQVGKDDNGGPLYAYLLKIRQEWFDEDQGITQERNDLVDEAIRSGKNTKGGTSPDGFYTPKEGIKYKT